MYKFAFTFLLVLVGLLLSPSSVHAQYSGNCCSKPTINPKCIVLFGERPDDCIESYCDTVEPEYRTINTCNNTVNIGAGKEVDEQLGEVINVNFFGIDLRFDTDRAIAQVIYFGFSAFLAAGALVAALIGVKASFERANAEDEEKIAAASKMVVNAIIGFAIMISSLVVVILVAALIGVGSLAEIVQVGNILPNF